MAEVYGVGHFKVENERGGEDSFTVTTHDDGTFCEVRAGDEDGDVVASDYVKAVARFGIDFQIACDKAFEDWHDKASAPPKDEPLYRQGDFGVCRPGRDPDADGRDDR